MLKHYYDYYGVIRIDGLLDTATVAQCRERLGNPKYDAFFADLAHIFRPIAQLLSGERNVSLVDVIRHEQSPSSIPHSITFWIALEDNMGDVVIQRGNVVQHQTIGMVFIPEIHSKL